MMDYSDMTYEQAEDVLNDTLHIATQDEMGGHAVYLASIALEKQTPKKPKRTVYNSTPDYIYCSCPVCNIVVARIRKDEYGELWEKHLPNYCDYCGQALYWSEVEEE